MNGEVSELFGWQHASHDCLGAPPTFFPTTKPFPQSLAGMEFAQVRGYDGLAGSRVPVDATKSLLERIQHLQVCPPVPSALLGLEAERMLSHPTNKHTHTQNSFPRGSMRSGYLTNIYKPLNAGDEG